MAKRASPHPLFAARSCGGAVFSCASRPAAAPAVFSSSRTAWSCPWASASCRCSPSSLVRRAWATDSNWLARCSNSAARCSYPLPHAGQLLLHGIGGFGDAFFEQFIQVAARRLLFRCGVRAAAWSAWPGLHAARHVPDPANVQFLLQFPPQIGGRPGGSSPACWRNCSAWARRDFNSASASRALLAADCSRCASSSFCACN